MPKTAQLESEIAERLRNSLTSAQIKALDPEMAATWIVGASPLSDAQRRVLTIACRDGRSVAAGTGEHRGRVDDIHRGSWPTLERAKRRAHEMTMKGSS